jgi:hypothetical protein
MIYFASKSTLLYDERNKKIFAALKKRMREEESMKGKKDESASQ